MRQTAQGEIYTHRARNSLAVGVNFTLGSLAHPNLPMPAGTVVAVTAVDSDTQDGLSCAKTFGPTGTPIPNILPGSNPLADLATRHSVGLTECQRGDSVVLDVTAPSGLKTTFVIPLL